MALIDDLRLARTRTKAFEFNVLLNGKDLSDIYQDMLTIIANTTGGSVPPTEGVSFLDLQNRMSIGTLTPLQWYSVNDMYGSVTGDIFYIQATSTSTINAIGTYKNASMASTPITNIVVCYAFAEGVWSPDLFAWFYEPICRTLWNGYVEPYSSGTDTRVFFDKIMSVTGGYPNGDYQDIVVKKGATFSGFPTKAFHWSFGNAIHQFGNSVELSNGSTTDTLDLRHKFPDGINVSNGVVGGAACSARTTYLINSDTNGVLDLTVLPMVKTIHVAIISPSSILTDILTWREQEADGSEIIIFPDGGCVIDMPGHGTAITNPLLIAPVNVVDWIKILNEGGDCYILDWK